MNKPKPRVYFLHGDDEFAMAEFIKDLRLKVGDDSTADMNIVTFNTSDLDWADLEAAANSTPFLSDRRLLILYEVEKIKNAPARSDRLIALCEHIPESTALLLVERNPKTSSKMSPIHKWAKKNPEICFIRTCTTPQGARFRSWLEEQAAAHGGSFEQDAAELLAEWTQEDPRLASQELRKLLDYVDLQRAIRVEDIEQCTPYRGQTTIFALVDALGQRRGEEAQKILHQVLQDADVRSVFGMIIRQFRLILLARDLMDSGKVPGNTIHKSDFVVKKVSTQARNFTLADLERIYHELLAIDLRSKNGEMDLEIALDSLVSVITS